MLTMVTVFRDLSPLYAEYKFKGAMEYVKQAEGCFKHCSWNLL